MRVHNDPSLVLVLAVLLVWTAGPTATARAEHEGEAAERAAREILDARDRANEAAQAMFDAESRLDSLTIELARAEVDLAALEAEVGEIRLGLTDSAVRQFVGAGRDSLLLFQDIGRGNETAAARVYASTASGSQLVQVDDYDQAIDELDDARHALEQKRSETADAEESWAALKADAEQQVLDLQRIEQERRADDEVQHEVERQRQARAEQERRFGVGRIADTGGTADADTGGTADADTGRTADTACERRQRHGVPRRRTPVVRRHVGRTTIGRTQP